MAPLSQVAQIAVPVVAKGGMTAAATIAGVAAAAIVAGVVVLAQRADPPQEYTAPTSVQTATTGQASTSQAAMTRGKGAEALDLVFTQDGPLGVVLAGAPLSACEAGDGPQDQSECAPSAAQIDLPEGAKVRYATLAWAAGQPGPMWDTATLTSPGGQVSGVVGGTRDDLLAGEQVSVDVTEIVSQGGQGSWQLSGVGPAEDSDEFAGWYLAVVYADDSLPTRRVSLYQGALRVQAGTGKELDVEAPLGTASHLGFVAWGADPQRTGSDIWMSSGVGQEAVSQELIANPFQGRAQGHDSAPAPGVDVFSLDDGVVFPSAEGAGTSVSLRVRAWGDANQSDPFTLGAVTLVADLPADD
jgi:hypothetical protein